MTERLYHVNSKLLEFTGRVADILRYDDRFAVVLDRTAFYPTGGGQPHDTGLLDGVRVVEVIEEEESGQVLHFVEGEVRFDKSDPVTGVIDRSRRLDHMQQHTGQHILSQAFVQTARAETKSFHLGAETSTIDLEWDKPDEALMRQAEDLANQIIFENRPVKIHQIAKEDLAKFPVRRDTYHGDVVRLIEISDFDFSPCCGTHAERTGEIGLIVIRGWERARKMCRVEFVCGGRALGDYRAANGAAKAVALMLTTARDDAPEKVARLLEESKQQRRRIRELFDLAADGEADRLLHTAESLPGFRLVRKIFDDRSIEEARVLARKLCDRSGVVTLFGLKDQGAARLLFARSADVNINMGELMKRVTEQFSGRGGGSPDMAQGGIEELNQLTASLDLAIEEAGKS
jgi:alanyl-tRNA synthetase